MVSSGLPVKPSSGGLHRGLPVATERRVLGCVPWEPRELTDCAIGGYAMERLRICRVGVLGLVFGLLAVFPTAGLANLYHFRGITNPGSPLESQLAVAVSDAGDNQVLFTFTNTAVTGSITDVYFDDGVLLGIAQIINSDGVQFQQYADPANLPDGDTLDPPFVATTSFSADSDPPVGTNGVDDPSESLGILFDIKEDEDYDFADVIAGIGYGFTDPSNEFSIRIGLRVQGASGVDGSFVAVPLPAAVLLGTLGLSVAGWRLRRFI